MGKIICNGREYSGSSDNAIDISYNNANSGLSATNLQNVIDELDSNIKKDLRFAPFTFFNGEFYTDGIASEYLYKTFDKMSEYQEIAITYRIGDAKNCTVVMNRNMSPYLQDAVYYSATYQGQVHIYVDWANNRVGVKTRTLVGWEARYVGILFIYGILKRDAVSDETTSTIASNKAVDITYDNSTSKLSATNVQSAIDEVYDKLYAKNILSNTEMYNTATSTLEYFSIPNLIDYEEVMVYAVLGEVPQWLHLSRQINADGASVYAGSNWNATIILNADFNNNRIGMKTVVLTGWSLSQVRIQFVVGVIKRKI